MMYEFTIKYANGKYDMDRMSDIKRMSEKIYGLMLVAEGNKVGIRYVIITKV